MERSSYLLELFHGFKRYTANSLDDYMDNIGEVKSGRKGTLVQMIGRYDIITVKRDTEELFKDIERENDPILQAGIEEFRKKQAKGIQVEFFESFLTQFPYQRKMWIGILLDELKIKASSVPRMPILNPIMVRASEKDYLIGYNENITITT